MGKNKTIKQNHSIMCYMDVFRNRPSTFFEGVYNSFNEIRDSLDIYPNASEYQFTANELSSPVTNRDLQNEQIKTALKARIDNRWELIEKHLCKGKYNKILEFGGNLGDLSLAYYDYEIEHHIIETPEAVEHSNFVFPVKKQNNKIIFALDTALSPNRTVSLYDSVSPICLKYGDHFDEIDILYSRVSIQYHEDWKQCLDSLIKEASPQKIILETTVIDDINTFYTIQFYLEKKLSICIINSKELDSYIKQHGYNLIYSLDKDLDFSNRSYNMYDKYKSAYSKNVVYEKL